MKRIPTIAWTVTAVVLAALLFNYAWSKPYPPMPAKPEEIKAQADLLRSIATPGLAFIGPVLGGVVSIGYVRRKRGFTPNQLAQLRRLYAETLILIFVSICSGIFLLLNLSLKVPHMGRLPLSIFSIRTDLFLQAFFLLAGLGYTVALLIRREK